VPVPSMGEKGGNGDGVKLGGGVAGLVCLGDGVDGGGGRGGESGGRVLREGASPSNVRSVISAVPALVSSSTIIALSIALSVSPIVKGSISDAGPKDVTSQVMSV